MARKKCEGCGEMRDEDYFHSSKKTKSGFDSTCKSCRKKQKVKSVGVEKLSSYLATRYGGY